MENHPFEWVNKLSLWADHQQHHGGLGVEVAAKDGEQGQTESAQTNHQAHLG